MKKFSIKLKILIPAIAVGLLGFVILTTVMVTQFTSTSDELQRMYAKEFAYKNMLKVKQTLENPLNKADGIASLIETNISEDGSLISQLPDSFEAWLKSNSDNFAIYVIWEEDAAESYGINATDIYAYKTGNKVTIEKTDEYISNDLYEEVKSSKNEYIINPRTVEVDGTSYFLISEAVPIVVDGTFVGIVGVDMPSSVLQYIVDEGSLFDNGYTCVGATDGFMVVHPNEAVIGKTAKELLSAENAEGVLNAIETVSYFSMESKSASTGVISLTAQAPMEIGDTGVAWTVITSVPLKELGASTTQSALIGIFLTVFFIILMVLVMYYIASRLISKPMVVAIDNIQEAAFHVTDAAGQLNTSSSQLSEGSNEQAASIEETSASMDETSSMVQRNAEHSSQANELSQSALSAAEAGSHKMKGMTQSMEELKKSSDEIAKIIKVINDIAFQTNMLALNAAVEAARAGDAGQGFAVVAEEVRNLAQKSAKAASDTAEIIENNIRLSEQGVQTSDDVNVSLLEIVEKVEKVNQLMNEINIASREQSSGVAQATHAIGQMEIVVQQNAASAQQTNASAEELSEQAVRLNEIVKSLTMMVKGNESEEDSIAKYSNLKAASSIKKVASPKSGKSIVSPDQVIPFDDDDDF